MRTENKIIIAAAILAALVLAFDLALPLGVAGGVPYVAVVLLGIWLHQRRTVIAFAVLTSMLTVLGYFLSPNGGIEWVVLTNRGLALFAIWSAALLVVLYKRAELDLRQSENLQAIIAETAPNPLAITRHDNGEILYANPAFAHVMGVDAGSLEGRPMADFYWQPNDREQLRSKLTAGGDDAGFEFEMRRADGEKIVVEITVRELVHDGQRALLGNFTDITARKRAEEEQRKLFRAIEQSPVSVLITDVNGSIEFVNPKFTEVSGYSFEELIGQNPRILKSADTSAEIYADLWDTIAHGGTWTGEMQNKAKDGSLFWEQVAISGVTDEQGQISNYIAVKEDVTDRKKTEEIQRRLVAAIDGVAEAVSIYDADDRLVYANRSLRDMGHHIADTLRPGVPFEARMRALLEKNPPIDALGRKEDWLRERLAKRGLDPEPFEITLQDGVTLLLREQRMPDGSIVRIGSDITEHKAMEAQLHQAQKLEAIGQLTGGIAHDVNNLLAIIMGNLQLLEYGAGLKGESQEFLWESLAAARRGADLTHRLLAFARNQPLRPQPLHVNAVIGGLKDMLERTLSAEIVLRYDLHEGRMVMADIQQLENAILNLAINARDAMVGGGTLTIRNSFRRLDGGELHLGESVEPGEYCDIEIRDTGTGMDGETLSKVFDPFFTTKEFGKGSGLGLSMVHGFVRQSNGYIDITSNLGAGTTVHLYLPLQTNETEVTVTEVTEGAWPNGAGEVVLVLEDEQDLRRTAANLLETLDYGALQASDAAEALALLDRGENVDLLFSDVVLPGGLTGPELYAKARLNYPDLKVLYCSGYTDNLPDRD
ncbi:MAG: PAS domain S-box protein, partial [Alphaproteobacteria bacterium]|nr:PAS domain S-box protein [Alphaproteobacteria bacterium]